MALLRLRGRSTRLDARQIKVRFGVRSLGVVHVVRRDDRQRQALGHVGKEPVEHGLLRQPVILKLDEEGPRLEDLREPTEHASPRLGPLLEHALRHEPPHASREADEPLRVRRDVLERDGRSPGRAVRVGLNVAARAEPDEVLVPLESGREDG